MTYGTRIKQAREEVFLTQEQLAEELDISRQAVSKWEADLSRPTREKLEKLSQILDIPPETWAEIDAELAAANKPPDTSRPWKIATAALAAVCAVLAVCLTVTLWPKTNVDVPRPAEDQWGQEPPEEDLRPVEPAEPEESEPAMPVLSDSFPLTIHRDYDFGDWPLGQSDDSEVPFLDDGEKVMEEELWCGWFPDGTRLSLVPVSAVWDETGQYANVYLLYAPPEETAEGMPEYHILYRVGEDYTGEDRGDPKGEAFTNLLGYDGFKISISAAGGLYRSACYITQRPDGTPCTITCTSATAYELDVDEDGLSEIVAYDDSLPGWEIIDITEGEEGAFIYTLDYTKTEPIWDQYLLGFDVERGGFVVVDGTANSVVSRCILRDGELVRVPPTDFSAADYADVLDTKVTFVTDVEILSDGLDPDELLPYNPDVRITHRQQAYLALQELYNLTGMKVDECYCTANEYGVHFSLLPDGFNQRGFFHFDFNTRYGNVDHIPSLYISWKELGNDWSPLSFSKAAPPEGETVNDQVRWYYDRMEAFHTGEVDRLSCFPLEEGAWQRGYEGAGEFYLADGSLYNVYYQMIDGKTVLTGLCGPYPDGVANH